MFTSSRNFLMAFCVLFMAVLACSPGGTAIYENTEAGNRRFVGYATPTIRPTRTPRTSSSESSIVDLEPPPVVEQGTCAWVRTADSQGYPQGEVSPDLVVTPYPTYWNKYGVETSFFHTFTDYGAQEFTTAHSFYIKEIYHPYDSERLVVEFYWENIGNAPDSSLVKAGGVTMLTIGDLTIKAENKDINVRTEPSGSIENAAQWIVPDGEVGDTFTMTQHISTGSFGVNVRWYFAYVCE